MGYRKMRALVGITPGAEAWEPGALREAATARGVPACEGDTNDVLFARMIAARCMPIVFPGKECLVSETFAVECEKAGILIDARTPREVDEDRRAKGLAKIEAAKRKMADAETVKPITVAVES